MLDAEQARQVMRRAVRMLGPYRRKVIVRQRAAGASGRARVLAGPFLVRYGIDHGLTAGRRRRPEPGHRRSTSSSPILGYVVYRQVIVIVSVVGEAFLRDLRSCGCSTTCRRLSMPFYDREKAGVVVSRMTSDVESLPGAGPVRAAHVRDQRAAARRSRSSCWRSCPGSCCSSAWSPLPPVVVASISSSGDSNQAYLVVRDRHRLDAVDLQEGISGVRVIQAFGREDVEVGRFRRRQPRALRRPHGVGEDPGLVPAGHRVRRPGHHGRRGRHRRLAGARRTSSRSARSTFFVLTLSQPVRAGPAAQPAVQHRAVGRGRR